MCGIGGMFGHPDAAVVHRMNALLHHRGPDGNAVWSDEQISLGHTRSCYCRFRLVVANR